MLKMHNNNEKFTKKDFYEKLSNKYGRTIKSFEYRMQNISYVLYTMNREWLPGLPPAKNVGNKNAKKIERFIYEIENRDKDFDTIVNESINRENLEKPKGSIIPKNSKSEVIIYERDPYVKAWVLKNSNGICERCKNKGPFMSIYGLPFLEVHHIKRLSDGGSDRITNVVALCPNCHREIHYGMDKDKINEWLYINVKRLIKE